MRFFVTGRRYGKTERMVQWLRANPAAIMVCHNATEADRLRKLNPDISSDRFVTVRAVQDGWLKGRANPLLGIDNLDLILPILLGLPDPNSISFVTATGENDG